MGMLLKIAAVSLMAIGLCAECGAASAPSAAGTAVTKIKLTPQAIPVPSAVLSRSEGEKGPDLLDGIVRPPSTVTFSSGNSQADFSAAGVKLTALRAWPQFGLKFNDKVQVLGLAGTALSPVLLPISPKRQYRLVFPYMLGGTESATIWYRSGFVMRGMIGGQTVCIYDDNTDGAFRLSDDSVRVGEVAGPVALFAPLSKYVATPAGVYRIDSIAEDGSELAYAPYTGKTAKLKVAFSSPEGEVHVAFGSKQAEMNLVLAANDRNSPVASVLPGQYDLKYGALFSFKTRRIAAVVKPGNMQAVTAEAGKTPQIKLGAPFVLEFAFQLQSGKLNIDPGSFHVRGAAGEEYVEVKHVAEPQIALLSGRQVWPFGKMTFR